MSAASRVFAIAELHENIFKQLPMKDLLLAQKINSSWRNAITASTLLQQQLLLKPMMSPDTPLVWATPPSSGLGKWYESSNVISRDKWGPQVNMSSKPFELSQNPVLELLEDQVNSTLENGLLGNVSLPAPWMYPDASWRRMLICQPAIRGSLRYFFWPNRKKSRCVDVESEDSRSITLDAVFEEHIKVQCVEGLSPPYDYGVDRKGYLVHLKISIEGLHNTSHWSG